MDASHTCRLKSLCCSSLAERVLAVTSVYATLDEHQLRYPTEKELFSVEVRAGGGLLALFFVEVPNRYNRRPTNLELKNGGPEL